MLVLFILTVAACEAAIALALVLVLARRTGRLDAAAWQDLREEGQPAYIDRQLPEQPAAQPYWPHLTPAGLRPKLPPEVEQFRPRV
jgi:NADH-quinone oxidoreductase subunit K